MNDWRSRLQLTELAQDLEEAHGRGVSAACAGMQDPALGSVRLSGTAVPLLAEAAVTSASPFLRAPLLARLSRVRLLHPFTGVDGRCPECGAQAPCRTAREVMA